MRTRSKALALVRRTPLAPIANWAVLNVLPGSAERRRHHAIDVLTNTILRTLLSADSNAIDVGAHQGVILREIVAAAPLGHHVAVEPIPYLAAGLRARFPNVTVHECALGSPEFVASTGGEMTLNVVRDDPGYSSVTRSSHPRLKSAVTSAISVKATTLDSLISEPVSLIKVDVEGFEREVLAGASGILRRYRPVVIFEHELVEPDPDRTVTEGIFEIFHDASMNIFEIERWQDSAPLTRESFVKSFLKGNSYFIALAKP